MGRKGRVLLLRDGKEGEERGGENGREGASLPQKKISSAATGNNDTQQTQTNTMEQNNESVDYLCVIRYKDVS